MRAFGIALLFISGFSPYADLALAQDVPRGQTLALDFKGMRIGDSPEALMAKYPDARCSDVLQKAATEKGHFKEFWERKWTEADVSCVAYTPFRQPPGPLSDIAGERAATVGLNFFNGRFVRGSATLSAGSFQKVLDALVVKYGPPSQIDNESIQLRTGAQLSNKIVQWRGQGGVIMLEEYFLDIRTSRYVLTTDEYAQENARRRATKAATGAGRL